MLLLHWRLALRTIHLPRHASRRQRELDVLSLRLPSGWRRHGPVSGRTSDIFPLYFRPRIHHLLSFASHGSYFTLHGQTYFAYNDRSHGGNQYFRNTLISYVNYFSNGSIPMLNVSAVGVGSLNVTADAPRVEAEQFFKITNASKTEIPMSGGQFEVSSLGNGSSLYYAKVYCQQTGVYSIALHVSNGSPTAGLVTISDGRQKTVLATCMVAPTGAWTTYQDVVCKGTVKLNPGQGTDLAFVFSARGADAFAHLDYWEIRST